MFTLLICMFACKLISQSSNYMFFFKVELTWIWHGFGSLVWDASATMIDVPLENAINMRSVWMAWFQFWGKRNIVNAQAKKNIKM